MVSIIFRACLGKHLLQLAGLLSLLSVLLLQFSTVSFQILLLLEHFQILAFGLRLKQISGQLQLPEDSGCQVLHGTCDGLCSSEVHRGENATGKLVVRVYLQHVKQTMGGKWGA